MGGIKGELRKVKGDRMGKKTLEERRGKLGFIRGRFYLLCSPTIQPLDHFQFLDSHNSAT